MGGSIAGHSQPGQGSEFVLTVPLDPVPSSSGGNGESPAQPLDADFANRHPLRILVVEDDKVNLKLILAILRRLGYEASPQKTVSRPWRCTSASTLIAF